MKATPPYIAHQARLLAHANQQATFNPQGNYDPSSFQWGVVDAVNVGPPPTVDLYLDGTQTLNDTAYLTPKVRYDASTVLYVNDVVLVYRGTNHHSSDRVVLLKLAGSASPTPLLLSGYNASSQYTQGPNGIWGGSGVPPATLGQSGDYYFRTDTPGTSSQRIYINNAGTWTALAV